MGLVASVCLLSGCNREQTASAPQDRPIGEVRGSRIEAPLAPTNEPPKPEVVTKLAPPEAPQTPAAPSPASTSASTSVSQPTEPPAVGEPGDPPAVGFDKLASFNYEMPDESLGKPETIQTNAPSQIPKTVLAYDKQRVALKGFMLPLKVESGLVTELLLMKDQSMCCYGAVPKITEWVSVKMTTKGIKPVMDQPVTLHGQLKVGEIRENGFLVGIYAMDGEKMIGPQDL